MLAFRVPTSIGFVRPSPNELGTLKPNVYALTNMTTAAKLRVIFALTNVILKEKRHG